MEAYAVAGVECQIVHVTIAAWERDMDSVLKQHEVASPLQKALSGTLTGLPLYGEDWIARWKARAAVYPDELREKMVAHYLKGTTRPDLRVASLSASGIPSREPEVWVIVQDEHLTFENEPLVWQLRGTAPWREIAAGNARAAQVFRIERRLPCCAVS